MGQRWQDMEVLWEDLLEVMTYKQRPKWSEEARLVEMWGKGFIDWGIASAKALWLEVRWEYLRNREKASFVRWGWGKWRGMWLDRWAEAGLDYLVGQMRSGVFF